MAELFRGTEGPNRHYHEIMKSTVHRTMIGSNKVGWRKEMLAEVVRDAGLVGV